MDRAPFYRALDIAVNYLSRRGYQEFQAHEKVRRHICRLWLKGESRPLMLANLSIAAVEKEEKMEEESRTVVLADFSRHHGAKLFQD